MMTSHVHKFVNFFKASIGHSPPEEIASNHVLLRVGAVAVGILVVGPNSRRVQPSEQRHRGVGDHCLYHSLLAAIGARVAYEFIPPVRAFRQDNHLRYRLVCADLICLGDALAAHTRDVDGAAAARSFRTRASADLLYKMKLQSK